MHRRSFGEAKDYYRLRIIKITEDEAPSIKWREGLNFSGYSTETLIGEPVKARTFFNLELVELDLSKTYVLSAFEKELLAQRALEGVEHDLNALTKNLFDNKYNIRVDVLSEDEGNQELNAQETSERETQEQDIPHQERSDEINSDELSGGSEGSTT